MTLTQLIYMQVRPDWLKKHDSVLYKSKGIKYNYKIYSIILK